MAMSDNDLILFGLCVDGSIGYDEALSRADSRQDLETLLARHSSVKQQNSATRAEIAGCARRMVNRDAALSWLPGVLEARHLDPSRGILATYSEKSDRGGRLCTGTWLTASKEFWDFRVLVPGAKEDNPIVELFEERSVSVFVHERGIVKSFGATAIEVLNEVLGAR